MKISPQSLLLVVVLLIASHGVWSFHASSPSHREALILGRQPGGLLPLLQHYRRSSNQWRSPADTNHQNAVTCFRTRTTALSMAAPAAVAAASSLSPVALGYMGLLALQFGLQPIVTRAFAPKTICRSTVVMMQEVAKLITSAALLAGSAGAWQSAVVGWSVHTWALVAGIPAGLYVIQNYCSLVAYQNLTPVTYNVLNQTKTLSAALFCFLFMGRLQSRLQISALFVLSMAALVLEKVVPLPWKTGGRSTVTTTTNEDDSTATLSDKHKDKMLHLTSGVLPVLAASAISGMTGVSDHRSAMLESIHANDVCCMDSLSTFTNVFLFILPILTYAFVLLFSQ
jgi:hypothetical protein